MSSKTSPLDLLLSAERAERAFASGQHKLELASRFGEDMVDRMQGLAESVLSRPPPASSPRVLIVPGLIGTTLGRRGCVGEDTIWFAPTTALAGRLLELAVDPSSPPLEPLEVLPSIYLHLKLHLQHAGYDVAFYPYDWRMSLDLLGAELAARLDREGRPVHLVAHSFGGLVSRAAMAAGAKNVGKVIMLGTPNHGTFSVVQGIRGVHWLLRTLSAFDAVHTAPELAARAFSTFPAVYEQLPSRCVVQNLDIYDPATWPVTGPSPRTDLLLRAPAVQDRLENVPGRYTVIAGYGYPTIDGLERTAHGFRYHRSTDGDGWVPASFAVLDACPRYFVGCPHMGMPNSEIVIAAVEDLLAGDGTNKLPQARPAPARLADHTDDAPLPPRFGGRKGLELTAEDIGGVLGQLFCLNRPGGPLQQVSSEILSSLAPLHTDWFTFLFWEIRKRKLGKGNGFTSAAIHLVRGGGVHSAEESRTLAERLGPPMRAALHHYSGPDPLAPLPFGLVQINQLIGLTPVYDLEARWSSAEAARRELADIFGPPPSSSWKDVHDPSVLVRLATEGLGAHLLSARPEGGYEIDLRGLARFEVRAPFEPYGTRLLLAPDLGVEAIERDGVVARPGDATFERSMMAFEASLAARVTVVDHSVMCHFVMAGTLVLALRRALPDGHPLRDVLTPFTFATTAVNSSGAYSLLAERAYFTRIFAFTHQGMCDLVEDGLPGLRFETFPERVRAQGLAAALDRLPFASDALVWWGAIDRFVVAILERWAHPADSAIHGLVEAFFELLPQTRFVVYDPRAALRRILAVTLFWITVMHEHCGDVGFYTADPTWMPVKVRPGDAEAQTLFKQDAVQKMILGTLTAEVEMPRILDDLSHVWRDAEMARVWECFHAEVPAVAGIAARNAARRPSDMLAPERIHVSVSL